MLLLVFLTLAMEDSIFHKKALLNSLTNKVKEPGDWKLKTIAVQPPPFPMHLVTGDYKYCAKLQQSYVILP